MTEQSRDTSPTYYSSCSYKSDTYLPQGWHIYQKSDAYLPQVGKTRDNVPMTKTRWHCKYDKNQVILQVWLKPGDIASMIKTRWHCKYDKNCGCKEVWQKLGDTASMTKTRWHCKCHNNQGIMQVLWQNKGNPTTKLKLKDTAPRTRGLAWINGILGKLCNLCFL